ncbi:MAG: DUF2804 domain-containing protein [Oscillospiraceae bacterium]|nr:DUF2804 domain-containing protein [Oscillospiraceae bacterium]
MMQHEITAVIPLLDEKGNLTEPGYARKLLPVYDRKAVKAGKMRIKEWDYYYIGNDRFGIALTIADNGYMALDSVSFLNFQGESWQVTKSPMRFFPMGKTNLPSSSSAGISAIRGKDYELKFVTENGVRHLTAGMENFKDGKAISIDVTLTDEPEDSIVICTPFEKKAHFYYNQKINCLRAAGTVILGDEKYVFDPSESFGVLDWGRGVWTYHNTWYWGSGSGLVGGESFGFNIGYGFGDTSAASENMLFYKGKAHKLSQVKFNIPTKNGRDDFLSPWTFTSDDGRFEMDFEPIIDRASNTDFKVLKSDQHQVFGKFTGKAVLDEGTVLEIKDFLGFAEKVENKW